MRKLKYIKLFEAFDSEKLSKTLSFISSKSKEEFKSILFHILNNIDFPVSKISDDYIDYLAFKNALNKIEFNDDVQCDAKSESQFTDHGIPGEVCKEGKIKRKWGSSTRLVSCPSCNGTGIKVNESSEIKLFKFWFDKDGNYIETTIVDGTKNKNFNLEGYKVVKQVIYKPNVRVSTQLEVFSHGDIVYFREDGREAIGRIFIEGNGYYVITDTPRFDGSPPNNTREWRKWGKYSWNVTGGAFTELSLLSIKEDDELVEFDPYEWNHPFNKRTFNKPRGIKLTDQLNNAHFALILDVSKLKKTDYTKVSDIKKTRLDSRTGSTYLMSNDDILNMNIDRFFDKLYKKSDITEDVRNIKKIILRSIGFTSVLFTTLNLNTIHQLTSIKDLYINFIKSENKDDKNWYLKQLEIHIHKYMKIGVSDSAIINKNIKTVTDKLKLQNDEYSEKYLKIINILNEITNSIYKKISESDIETIFDIEIVISKLLNIKRIFNNYEELSYLTRTYIRSLSNNPFRYKEISESSIDSMLIELNNLKKSILNIN
jgi:hypothetical protein